MCVSDRKFHVKDVLQQVTFLSELRLSLNELIFELRTQFLLKLFVNDALVELGLYRLTAQRTPACIEGARLSNAVHAKVVTTLQASWLDHNHKADGTALFLCEIHLLRHHTLATCRLCVFIFLFCHLSIWGAATNHIRQPLHLLYFKL